MPKTIEKSVDYLTPRQGFERGWDGGRAFERERAARIADDWRQPETLRLRAGEMTAQEIRTAQAVAAAISREIRRAPTDEPSLPPENNDNG